MNCVRRISSRQINLYSPDLSHCFIIHIDMTVLCCTVQYCTYIVSIMRNEPSSEPEPSHYIDTDRTLDRFDPLNHCDKHIDNHSDDDYDKTHMYNTDQSCTAPLFRDAEIRSNQIKFADI